MSRFCTGCGAPISDNKKFCTECGTPVPVEEAAAVQETMIEQMQEAAEIPAETVQQSARQPQARQQQTSQPAYQQPPVQQAASQQYYQQPTVQPVYQQAAPAYDPDAVPPKGSKYEPITAGGYIGIMLLMCIPIIGLILTIIWACGGCKKVNKRNLAKATLIMMAISLVISLIMGFVVKKVINSAIEASGLGAVMSELEGSGLTQEQEDENAGALGGLLGLIGGGSDEENSPAAEQNGLFGQNESSGQSDASGQSDSAAQSSSNGQAAESDSSLADALGALAILAGTASGDNSDVTNSDIEELQALGALIEGLEGLEGGSGEESGLGDLIDGAIAANQDAEALNDGWPKTLRNYPDGTATAVASYRTEITGTTKETMLGWIDQLKNDGFEFQDFYGFGFSESDMLSMDAWWAYDGKTYLSVSYYDGTVTVDHTKELPDLESYFGG